MLKNYITIAFRTILRNKVRTLIHVLGLSLGIGICLLIFQVVLHAYSFDTFHPDGERIYRIHSVSEWQPGEKFESAGSSGPLGEVIDEELSIIEAKARLYALYETTVIVPEQQRFIGKSNRVAFADPGFFEVFPREWLAGNPSTALAAPYQCVISESNLATYFPGYQAIDVLGKEMLWIDAGDSLSAYISGVVRDFDQPTDFIFTDFISFSSIAQADKNEWYGLHSWTNLNSSNQLFVKVREGVSKSQLNESLHQLVAKYIDSEEGDSGYDARSLREMHFTENFDDTVVSRDLLNGLVYIGLIILLLACLNFINLETALAIRRSKEVGIRKSLGSDRKQLIFQFLSETFLLVLLSSLIGLLFSNLTYQFFSSYLPESFTFHAYHWTSVAFLVGIAGLITLLSGLYPSIILSTYQPQRALKGEVQVSSNRGFGPFLRKNLTVIQFTASIAFICLVLVLRSQMQYISSQPLGFEKEAVLYTQLPFMGSPETKQQLAYRLQQESYVASASLSNALVSSNSLWTSDAYFQTDSTEQTLYVHMMNVDSAFVSVHGLQLLAGRKATNQGDEVLVNERFLQKVGISEPSEAIGRQLRTGGEARKIVGVLNNFNARNLREEILPMVVVYQPDYYYLLTVKVQPNQNLAIAKQQLQAMVKEVYPYETGEFEFIDEVVKGFYQADEQIQGILTFASGIAILISILGLFGLSSFTIAQRTKEVSIRKVLGAGTLSILFLICRQYIALIVVATVLAFIPAYYFSNQWLQEFAYRISVPYLLFGMVGLGVLLLALGVVIMHSLGIVKTNPAKVLKSE
jgi:putative ABC transport system permease protein